MNGMSEEGFGETISLACERLLNKSGEVSFLFFLNNDRSNLIFKILIFRVA